MNDQLTESMLNARCGSAVVRIRRIFYTLADVPDRSCGAVELAFSDGAVCLLDAGADGERLVGENNSWEDPFSEPISAENSNFIKESGKWSAYDVSSEHFYEGIVGGVVSRWRGRYARHKLIGIDMVFDTGFTLECVVESDELYVNVRN